MYMILGAVAVAWAVYTALVLLDPGWATGRLFDRAARKHTVIYGWLVIGALFLAGWGYDGNVRAEKYATQRDYCRNAAMQGGIGDPFASQISPDSPAAPSR